MVRGILRREPTGLKGPPRPAWPVLPASVDPMEHRAAYNRPDGTEVRFLFESAPAGSRLIWAFSLLAWSLGRLWCWAWSCRLIGGGPRRGIGPFGRQLVAWIGGAACALCARWAVVRMVEGRGLSACGRRPGSGG